MDIIELAEDVGEAKATAEAALQTAQIAEAEATIAVAESSHATAGDEATASGHCGPDCPCHQHAAEVQAALVALSDKYDDDMDTIARALDFLLGEAEPEESEESDGVEVISPEEANGSDATEHQSEPEGHGAAGTGSSAESASEAQPSSAKPERHKRPAPASRIGFRRGR